MQLSESVTRSQKPRGICYAIFGTMLWGISGSVAQYLFASAHVSPTWLVGVRLLSAGVLLLGWFAFDTHRSLWSIFKTGMVMPQLRRFFNFSDRYLLSFIWPQQIVGCHAEWTCFRLP